MSGGRRVRPWAWVLVGAVFVLLGGAMLAASAGAWAERDDYRDAPRCAEGRYAGCVRDMTAVVERTRVSRHKSDEYYVTVRLADPALAEPEAGVDVELPEPDEVFGALTPGRPVRVRVWDGAVTRIEVDGAGAAETAASPLTASLELTVVGLFGLAGGGFAVWLGVDAARQGDSGCAAAEIEPGRRGAWAATGYALVALCCGVMATFAQVLVFDVYEVVPFFGTLAATSAACWLLLRRSRTRG